MGQFIQMARADCWAPSPRCRLALKRCTPDPNLVTRRFSALQISTRIVSSSYSSHRCLCPRVVTAGPLHKHGLVGQLPRGSPGLIAKFGDDGKQSSPGDWGRQRSGTR